MKNRNLSKSLITTVVLFGCLFTSARAQHMQMHKGHAMAKNAYFVMMDTMMQRMATAPAGSSDAEYYINQMLPHHQGAIEMARYEIANGKNSEMIQLAKSILAEQQTEIMQLEILRKRLNQTRPIGPEFKKSVDDAMEIMMKTMPAEVPDRGSDKMFAAVMLPHHQAAIDMSKKIFSSAEESELLSFVKMLISNEQIEIDQMNTYLKQNEK